MMRILLMTLVLFVFSPLTGQNNPIELGNIHWSRDYNQAIKKANGKPVLILFQEVPGCSTCQNYGRDVLSHPLIVEAIETYFSPLCIYNNKKGKDAEILAKYNEPAWNNPVIRIVDSKTGKDIVPRLAGKYSAASLVDQIQLALLKTGKMIPGYLDLLSQELRSKATKETFVSMHCFWEGEKAYADVPGIIETDAGFMNGKEVVRIKYDPQIIDAQSLLKRGKEKDCAQSVMTTSAKEIDAAKSLGIGVEKRGKFRLDPESKYYLFKSKYRNIPMTALQKIKANAALAKGLSPDEFLSPRQLKHLKG